MRSWGLVLLMLLVFLLLLMVGVGLLERSGGLYGVCVVADKNARMWDHRLQPAVDALQAACAL
jgi:hypothetical protein